MPIINLGTQQAAISIPNRPFASQYMQIGALSRLIGDWSWFSLLGREPVDLIIALAMIASCGKSLNNTDS